MIKKHKQQITTSQFVVLILFSSLSHLALAAGGFTEATMTIEFQTGLYNMFIVVLAITPICVAFEGTIGNMTWTEILKKYLWILLLCASVVIVAYLWKTGGKITFG
jgi:hypothetical protein